MNASFYEVVYLFNKIQFNNFYFITTSKGDGKQKLPSSLYEILSIHFV